MCNQQTYDRNITLQEAQTGWTALVDTCAGGGSFAGEHRANGIKYAAYGTKAGVNIRPHPNRNDTMSPNRRWRLSSRADCNDVGTTGISHFDCPKPEGHVSDADGNCPGFDDTDNKCKSYCEIRRTGFLGPEEIVPGEAGEIAAKGKQVNVEKGKEISITHGFSVGLSAEIRQVVSLGVSYECKATAFPRSLGTDEVPSLHHRINIHNHRPHRRRRPTRTRPLGLLRALHRDLWRSIRERVLRVFTRRPVFAAC